MMVVQDRRDLLTTLVHRLEFVEPGSVEHIVRLGDDVRLARCRGELYIALVTNDNAEYLYQLERGLGRLVWTLAIAAPTRDCERARRVLAEADILAV